ncbi:uncharacterized protein PRCAT00001273001 [Priceomyces carsonii]|uniref:uncharacterized protein n=1 Tax=Priceomyces carsonii TaxID=28549 RepID=UPI002ED8E370|nr:unnamed protein product [Priceomyces carsonii]
MEQIREQTLHQLPSHFLSCAGKSFKDNFDLSSEMDFEHAYAMYNTLQHKNAKAAVEQLKKVQMLNEQYKTVLLQTQTLSTSFPGNQEYRFFNINNTPSAATAPPSHSQYCDINVPSQDYQQNPSNELRKEENQKVDMLHTVDAQFFDPSNEFSNILQKEGRLEDEPSDVENEFDKFFSNTESDALDKFLDNLANPNTTDPLKFYNIYDHHNEATSKPINTTNEVLSLYDKKHKSLSTKDQHKINENMKDELAEAFGQPLSRDFSGSETASPRQNQLPTPVDSRQSSLCALGDEDITYGKRGLDDNGISSPSPKKRKRLSHKPLLSLEQKRLNHSHSEQKRRQLCKMAYDRCLRLIVNVEEYNKEVNNNKKSKRAKFKKYGLPNLSKHTALVKISHEITRIKCKNEELLRLLNEKL